MAATTLDQLVLAIGRRFGQAASGTATGGGTASLIDTAALWQPDGHWVNHYVRFTSGSNANAERLITASVQSSKTLTLDPSLTNAVAASDAYQILPLPRADIVGAIQDAIYRMGAKWVATNTDQTIGYSGDQEYDLPTDLLFIISLWLGSAEDWSPITNYEVVGEPGALVLNIRDGLDARQRVLAAAGTQEYFRVVYAALPTLISTGSASLGVGETQERDAIAYIQEYALHLLHQGAVARNKTGESARASLSLAQMHLAESEKIRTMARPQVPMRRARTRMVPRHI